MRLDFDWDRLHQLVMAERLERDEPRDKLRERIANIPDILNLRIKLANGIVSSGELHRYMLHQKEFRCTHANTEHFIEVLLGVDAAFAEVIWRPRPDPRNRERIIGGREPDTYHYVPSAAASVLEFLDKVPLSPHSVVYDIGSGLGKAAILIGLLTGARVVGVEWEPEYCLRAIKAAQDLNLANVSFVNADAKTLDYAGTDVFYMFTPFYNQLLEEFLDRNVHAVASAKPVTVAFHGPHSGPLRGKAWLKLDPSPGSLKYLADTFRFEKFHSGPELVAAAK